MSTGVASSIEQPTSQDQDAPIKDYVPSPAIPDNAYAHLSNPITLIGQSVATLLSDGLEAGTQRSFSRYGDIKNITVTQWIRLGDVMGARGGEAGQKYLVIIIDTNAGYACIRPHNNPVATIPEYRADPQAAAIFSSRVILIPIKKTP